MIVFRHLLMFLLLAVSHSLAENTTCDSEAPVDSAEKAWCVVSEFLAYQSCASAYSREAVELEDRWELKIRGRNSAQTDGCQNLHIAVCKATGKILHPPDSGTCDGGSIEIRAAAFGRKGTFDLA